MWSTKITFHNQKTNNNTIVHGTYIVHNVDPVILFEDEVRALLLALVQVDQLRKATELQDVYSTAITSTISLVPEVWSEDVVNSAAQVNTQMTVMGVGGSSVG